MANSIEDYLIDGLSFKLSKGASYVQSRKQVTFWPSGSNIYSTTGGTKVLKIHLNGDAWCDPTSVRIMYDLRNNDTTAGKRLRPVGGPWTFWRRMRIMCGGQVVEDIDYYNRTHEMFNSLTSYQSRQNDLIEGFGYSYDSIEDVEWPVLQTAGSGPTQITYVDKINLYSQFTLVGIKPGGYQTVSFKPLSGLFSQPKFLPIRYAPITIEFELVNNALDPIVEPNNTSGYGFPVASTSVLWQIENVQLKADLCTLDNGLENSYSEHLLSGKTLPINYTTHIVQAQAISGTNISVNVSRAISRLKSIFVTMQGFPRKLAVDKEWNLFTHPMSQAPSISITDPGGAIIQKEAYDPDFELEYQIQIGSKLFPDYPVRSLAEAFAKLKQCVYGSSNNFHAISFSDKNYRNDKFIIGVDTEKVPDAGFTGLNSRAGDLITVMVKAMKPSTFTGTNIGDPRMPTTMFITLHSDNIMEIGATGVQVFD